MDKLQLFGHVHDNPAHKVSSYYVWPLGAPEQELKERVAGFARAFTPIEILFDSDEEGSFGWVFAKDVFEKRMSE